MDNSIDQVNGNLTDSELEQIVTDAPLASEHLETLPVKTLKTMAMEIADKRKDKKSWLQTATKEDLVYYISFQEIPTSVPVPATNGSRANVASSNGSSDLGQLLAQSVAPWLNDLLDQKLDEEGVKKIADERIKQAIANHSRTITVKLPNGATANVGRQHKQFDELLLLCSLRMNVYLVGPAASGKTAVAEAIAKALGLKYSAISVCGQTPVSALFGFMNANGIYVRTEFRDRYEFGGIFLLDEFDNGNANTGAALNQATANGQCAFPDGMIKKHPDFVCIAAGNTYGGGADRVYVGRNQLDGATLNRFVFLDWDYDESLEMEIAPNKDWCKFVQSARQSAQSHSVRHIISMRATLYGGTLINAGIAKARVEKMVLWQGLAQSEVNKIKASMI
jgi:cobaltochelatase CobS